MKGFRALLIRFNIGLAIAITVAVTALPESVRAEEDTREAIVLDAESRAFVIREMQQFVSGLQQAMVALSTDDVKSVAAAVRPLGMQGMSSAPPNLMSTVPQGFRQIGMPIHMAFDKIADAAEQGATAQEILSGLGMAMNRCVACHAAYRIEPR